MCLCVCSNTTDSDNACEELLCGSNKQEQEAQLGNENNNCMAGSSNNTNNGCNVL